jgi:hypothetical protein
MSTESRDLGVEDQAPDDPLREPHRGGADHFMRRLLRLPTDGPKATAADAHRAFQTSLMVATVRCLLMYVVFPFVLPAVGWSAGVGPLIGLPISAAAIVAIVMSIRRFWRADHSKRWHYTILGTTVIGFMIVLIVRDLSDLLH